MRGCLALVGVWLLVASVAPAAEVGLVGRWSFDEPAGEVALDGSGHGLAGKIIGAVRVPSPHGQALRFDGVKDYVDLGQPAGLMLSGDLTIEAWVRPTDLSGRNRMILGDGANLSVLRNYSLRFDLGGIFFEYGNNEDSTQVVSTAAPVLNEWSHLAMVAEYPRYYLYLNGKLIQTGTVGFPLSPTKGAVRRIGGWDYGWFKGDMDEVALWNRALPERAIMEHAGLTPQARLVVNPVIVYGHQRLTGDVTYQGPLAQGAAVSVEVRQAGKNVLRQQLALQETRPGSERWLGKLSLSTARFAGGEYEVVASARSASGEALATGRGTLQYPRRPPLWYRSQAGVMDKPSAPFGPVTGGYDTCGRKYTRGTGPLPAQVEALKQPLLAGPIRLVGPVALSGSMKQDYDGFLKVEMTVKRRDTEPISGLVLEVPLRPEVAKYTYSWPKITSRALTADVTLPFQPILWLGDEEKGLSCLWESDQNWSLKNREQAVRIVRGDKETVLRLTLIDTPTKLPTRGLRYTFALQATPLRPKGPDAWDQRLICETTYGQGLKLPEEQIEGKPSLQYYADKGVKSLVITRWWEAFAYPSPLGHEQEFRKLVQACHAVGIKLVPYVGGFLLSERAPEAALFKQEMTKWPLSDYALRVPGMPDQTGFITCQNSCWQDFLVDGIARLIDDYDVDGVYLDSTTIPWACTNELHGCGYPKADGLRAATYPVFAIRRNLQRIYNVVRSRKPDGIVDMHVYDCMNPPALAYCTSYWIGEHMGNSPVKTDTLPLDRFRAEFMGYNWGVPADLLYYMLHDYRKCTALAVLHDVPVRSERLTDLALQSELFALHDRYPYKQAEWLPYWRNQAYVQVGPEGCYASLYRHPQQGVLIYVSNLTAADKEAELQLDLAKLGLPGDCTAADALTGQALPLAGGVLKLPLKSQDFAALWLRGR